jgi:hypothetical protein
MPSEHPKKESDNQVDVYWVVANIFAIIHILEDKFGVETVERLVAAATAIESEMRKEAGQGE